MSSSGMILTEQLSCVPLPSPPPGKISITDLRLDLGNPDPDSRGSVSIRRQAGDTLQSISTVFAISTSNNYNIRNIYQQNLQRSFEQILTMGLTHRKQRQGRKKTVKTRSFSPLHILLGWMIKGLDIFLRFSSKLINLINTNKR